MEYELYHHGTKGMKWGIRRYQNKDGSLTPAGRKRYASEAAKLKDREKVIKTKERTNAKIAKLESKKAELDAREKALTSSKVSAKTTSNSKPADDTPKQKSVKDMSDDELRTVVNRMQLEQQYRNLNPQKVSAGRKFAEGIATKVLIPAATEVGKKLVTEMLKQAASNATGLDLGGGKKNDKKKDD